MKKILLILICFSAIVILFSDSQELLNNYYNDATLENIKAVLDEAHQAEKSSTAQLNLLLLHFNEMSKAITQLESMNADLQPAQRFQLANIYLALGENEKAITHYDILNEKFVDWSCPWRHKGEAYYNLENWENSEKALSKAIEARIEHYDAYLWLARVQLKQGKNKEALKTFDTGMSYKGKDTEDPEEEFSSEEESFLKLDILKANKLKKEVKELEKALTAKYPDSNYWIRK